MQKTFAFLITVAALTVLTVGCAGPERKLGRGVANIFEPVRMGEMRRSVEQTGVFYSPNEAYTRGVIEGFNRTLVRTGLGVYEIATFPIPSYDPILTDYLAPNPVYPANYKPAVVSTTTFETGVNVGFSGGSIAPWIPGNRFYIFER